MFFFKQAAKAKIEQELVKSSKQVAEDVKVKINGWENKIDIKYKEIKQLERKVKDLLLTNQKNKKTLAMTILKNIKRKRQAIVKLNKQLNLLIKKEAVLSSQEEDEELYRAMKGANKTLEKTLQTKQDQIEVLEQTRELETRYKELEELHRDLMEDSDDDEIDDMLKEYEAEAIRESQLEFSGKSLPQVGLSQRTRTNTTQPKRTKASEVEVDQQLSGILLG